LLNSFLFNSNFSKFIILILSEKISIFTTFLYSELNAILR